MEKETKKPGGKRPGAGRKAGANGPKKTKTFRLDPALVEKIEALDNPNATVEWVLTVYFKGNPVPF